MTQLPLLAHPRRCQPAVVPPWTVSGTEGAGSNGYQSDDVTWPRHRSIQHQNWPAQFGRYRDDPVLDSGCGTSFRLRLQFSAATAPPSLEFCLPRRSGRASFGALMHSAPLFLLFRQFGILNRSFELSNEHDPRSKGKAMLCVNGPSQPLDWC